MKHNAIGVRCPNCGCTLDYGERCDCEQREAEMKRATERVKKQKAIRQNTELMAQAEQEWLWS